MFHIEYNSYSLDGFIPILTATVVLAVYMMQVIAYCGMFKKSGEKRWKAFVPFVNRFTQYKISWSGLAYIFLIICAVIRISPEIISRYMPYFPYMNYVQSVGSVGYAVLHIIGCYKLSRSFGHKVGYTIGLLLMPQIFMLTIGIGNSEYIKEKK